MTRLIIKAFLALLIANVCLLYEAQSEKHSILISLGVASFYGLESARKTLAAKLNLDADSTRISFSRNLKTSYEREVSFIDAKTIPDIKKRLGKLEMGVNNFTGRFSALEEKVDSLTKTKGFSCKEILKSDKAAASGVYNIRVSSKSYDVYCDMTGEEANMKSGGWMRIDSTLDIPKALLTVPYQNFVKSNCDSEVVICAYTIYLPRGTRGVTVSKVIWEGVNGPYGLRSLAQIEDKLRYASNQADVVGLPLSMIINASNGDRPSLAGGVANVNNKALATVFFGSTYNGTLLPKKAVGVGNLNGLATHDGSYFNSYDDVGFEADRLVFLLSDSKTEKLSVVGFKMWVR